MGDPHNSQFPSTDNSGACLLFAGVLLTSGLYFRKPTDVLVSQAVVLLAVFLWSHFVWKPIQDWWLLTHRIDRIPRLPPYRILQDSSWTSIDSDDLSVGDLIEVSKGQIVPADADIKETQGDFQVRPEAGQVSKKVKYMSTVLNGSAQIIVTKPISVFVHEARFQDNWKVGLEIKRAARILSDLTVLGIAGIALIEFRTRSIAELVTNALEVYTILWIFMTVISNAYLFLLRSVQVAHTPSSIAYWSRSALPHLLRISTFHLSIQDQFVSSPAFIPIVLYLSQKGLCSATISGQGFSPRGTIAGLEFSRHWFLLASACAALSEATLSYEKAAFRCVGKALDCALRVLTEKIGGCDFGYATIKAELSPQQYTEHLLRDLKVVKRDSDSLGSWLLGRKPDATYQTFVCGSADLLQKSAHFLYQDTEFELTPDLKSILITKVSETTTQSKFICFRTQQTPDTIEKEELTLLGVVLLEEKLAPGFLDAYQRMPEFNFLISVPYSQSTISTIMHDFPDKYQYSEHPSPSALENCRLTLVPEVAATKTLQFLKPELTATSSSDGENYLHLAESGASLRLRCTADVVLRTDSILGVKELIEESQVRTNHGIESALLVFRGVVAFLIYYLLKHFFGLADKLSMFWIGFALAFAVLAPAHLVSTLKIAFPTPRLTAFSYKHLLLTSIFGVFAGVSAVLVEYQCYLYPEYILDITSQDFLSKSQFFYEQVQAIGVKVMIFNGFGFTLWKVWSAQSRYKATTQIMTILFVACFCTAWKTNGIMLCWEEAKLLGGVLLLTIIPEILIGRKSIAV